MPFGTARCGAEGEEEVVCRMAAALDEEERMLLFSTAGVGEGVGKADEIDLEAEINEESPGTSSLTEIWELLGKEVLSWPDAEKEQVWEDGNVDVGIEADEDAADKGGEAGMLVEGDGKTEESAVGVALVKGKVLGVPFIFSVLLNLIISFLVKPFEKQHFSFLDMQAEQGLNCK